MKLRKHWCFNCVRNERRINYLLPQEDNEVNYQTSSTTAYDIDVTYKHHTVGGATLSLARTEYAISVTAGDDATEMLIAAFLHQ